MEIAFSLLVSRGKFFRKNSSKLLDATIEVLLKICLSNVPTQVSNQSKILSIKIRKIPHVFHPPQMLSQFTRRNQYRIETKREYLDHVNFKK